MSSHEGNSTNKAPLFNGTNFTFWKVRMRTYIMALGADVWDVVETGYVKPIVLRICESYAPRNCQRNVGQTN
jgi:hypothetical protein